MDGRTCHVAGMDDSSGRMAAFAPEVEIAVFVTVECDADLVGEIKDVLGALANAQLDRLSGTQPVPHAQGVVDVLLGGVVGTQNSCHAALCVLGVVVG